MSGVACRQCGETHAWVHAETAEADILMAVEEAIADYHYALDTRQNGHLAAHKAVEIISCLLDMPWRRGEEFARREQRHDRP